MHARTGHSHRFVTSLAVLLLAGCSTGGGTASTNPTDAQMASCRTAAENYWKAPSGNTYVNSSRQNAAGGFDVQLVTSDEFRTTCTISAGGQISTRPGW